MRSNNNLAASRECNLLSHSLKTELQPVPSIVTSKESLWILLALRSAVRRSWLICLSGCRIAAFHMMLPDPLAQCKERFWRFQFEARVSRRLGLVRTEGNVDLLARCSDIEPVKALVTAAWTKRSQSVYHANEPLCFSGTGLAVRPNVSP